MPTLDTSPPEPGESGSTVLEQRGMEKPFTADGTFVSSLHSPYTAPR